LPPVPARITIITIALLGLLIHTAGPQFVFLLLAPGPLLGLAALRRLAAKQRETRQVRNPDAQEGLSEAFFITNRMIISTA
jgi:hypothetical protein